MCRDCVCGLCKYLGNMVWETACCTSVVCFCKVLVSFSVNFRLNYFATKWFNLNAVSLLIKFPQGLLLLVWLVAALMLKFEHLDFILLDSLRISQIDTLFFRNYFAWFKCHSHVHLGLWARALNYFIIFSRLEGVLLNFSVLHCYLLHVKHCSLLKLWGHCQISVILLKAKD